MSRSGVNCRGDCANIAVAGFSLDGDRVKKRLQRWAVVAVVVLMAALIFAAYRRPALLLDFVNLRYCG